MKDDPCPPGTVYADHAGRTVVIETGSRTVTVELDGRVTVEAAPVVLDWATVQDVVREYLALGHYIRVQTTESREEIRA